jgi:hypothetical protein
MKKHSRACLFLVALFLLAAPAPALTNDTVGLQSAMPAGYSNHAQTGSYINPTWVGEVPEWNYYDVFGNHLLDGFYLFNMSMSGDGKGQTDQSDIALSPILKKWLNGMVQVGDIADNRGVLAMVGDRVATTFTPFTFNQSLFCGARVDVFFDLYGMNSLSIINSRISSTGSYGMYMDNHIIVPSADWLHGIHVNKNIKDIFTIGATAIDMRNQINGKSGSLDGVKNDSFPNSMSALQIYGVDGRCTLPKLKAYGEWAQSQNVIGGDFKPRPGNVGTLNVLWNTLDQLKLGGEGYIVQARYRTTFYDPVFPTGDYASHKYLYSLVEDNDDKDQFPENGQESKINFLPLGGGDQDGVMPAKFDKNKDNIYDWEEDFLNYESDPPKSDLYYDRNNNGVPDEIEDDAYPDYPYVPSYYLSGERYLRQDDRTGKWIQDIVPDTADVSFNMERQVSKGLLGFHLHGQYELLPKLSLTLGGIVEKSEKNSFQMTYENTRPIGCVYAPEKDIDLYSVVGYQHDFTDDKKLTVKNYLRYVQDNIPNHTLVSHGGINPATYVNDMLFTTVPDQLDYRDAVVEMLVAQYDIYKSRGFNLTSRGKYEFTKHVPHLDFNYADANISSLTLVNKCEYIWLLPFSKDMFLIPKYKNVYDLGAYGPRADSLADSKYRGNTMSNNAYLVYEWKFTPKTSITIGGQFELFNDFANHLEDYEHGNGTLQLMIKDRYAGLNMILTTGIAWYGYDYYNSKGTQHNPFNNPYRITDNISAFDIFFKIYTGF